MDLEQIHRLTEALRSITYSVANCSPLFADESWEDVVKVVTKIVRAIDKELGSD